MATLGQLKERILSKLDDGDIQHPTTAQVTDQINSTIEYYEVNAFWFSEAISNPTLTIGDAVVPLPSDFKQLIEPNAVVIVESQVSWPLQHITPLQYDSINTEALGLPRYYTFRNGQLELLFFPDKVYVLDLFYRKSFADLDDDADSNDFTNKAARLIEYKTLTDLLRDYRADFERAAVYEQRAEVEFNKIKKETYNRTSTGNLVTENIVSRGRDYYYF